MNRPYFQIYQPIAKKMLFKICSPVSGQIFDKVHVEIVDQLMEKSFYHVRNHVANSLKAQILK